MVRASVFQDLKDTLIACHWLAGTTSRALKDPDTGASGVITRVDADVYPLLESAPITLIDYFPDASGETESKTAVNTLALDAGQPGDPTPVELGSSLIEQPYQFNLAFYAVSDAVAQAVFADLRDRWYGRIVDPGGIPLYNFLADPSIEVTRLDVDSFRFSRDANTVSPAEVHLYFGELIMTDFVD
jgi:hypothetical protein